MVDLDYCMSSYLMYRRVVDPDKSFFDGNLPKTIPSNWKKTPIRNSFELEDHLRKRVEEACSVGNPALALSGGIDSAVLAKFMPKGSTAYTFKCVADGRQTVDETARAAVYAEECGLNHKIIEINWDDMKNISKLLMKRKHAPLHSIEVQIYKGGMAARNDGFDSIIYGETADVNYGGLSNILSRDWRVGEFIERYAYLKPWMVLKNPKIDFSHFSSYEKNGFVDVHRYLSNFNIMESLNSYVNACECAGIGFIAPFADTYLDTELDYCRIRNGENKYLIREVFNRLYPDFEAPDKIPMPRATDVWLEDWAGPSRDEFIPNCVHSLTGDQKWMLYCLEEFLNLNE